VDELKRAWEEHAVEWIAWARTPGHDSYWQFHRDLFLELVPPASGRTLDLGCGEGRLARDLAALGHDVAGVDSSPTLIAAARDAAPGMELHLADAAALPFADASFGLVVAFMSLHDFDDLDGAVRETARVLSPGGRLCLAIVHPLASAGAFVAREATSPFVIEGSYLDERRVAGTFARDGLTMTFVSAHRPLQAYVRSLADAGLLVEELRETPVPERAFTGAHGARWTRIPNFLHLRALKPG
jgi:SAM-dependent methyltransferase